MRKGKQRVETYESLDDDEADDMIGGLRRWSERHGDVDRFVIGSTGDDVGDRCSSSGERRVGTHVTVSPMAFRLTVNLGNSIIGVSILTMPYCFRRCGILLSIVSIVVSGLLNRAGCHLLFRSAVLTRKRTFEDIALQVLGPIGKLVVELCVLGFLLGTCVAYFVVIGDLGPSIVSDVTGWQKSAHLRAFTMTFVGMFVALPLGLLRRVDSLSSFSALSFVVYLLLVAKLVSQTSISLLTGGTEQSVSHKFVWWDAGHLLENMPIFAMSLSCQTQLFELFDHSFLNFEDYDVVPKLNRVVRRAVHLCSLVYVSIGLFGYVAFHDVQFGGNILSFLPASLISTAMKLAFVATVAVSLPLCLFPCRTSLFSLLIKSNKDSSRSSLMNEFVLSPSAHHMSDRHFRFLTVLLIVFTVSISVVVPRIEFVLSIIGSTTGTIICFILPGHVYSQLMRKNTTERVLARFVIVIGFFILVICTLASLSSFSNSGTPDDVSMVLSTKSHSLDHGLPALSVSDKNGGVGIAIVEPVRVKADVINSSQLKDKQEELLRKLEKNQEEQKQLIEEQKKVLQEFKKHEQVHSDPVKPAIPSQTSNWSSVSAVKSGAETKKGGATFKKSSSHESGARVPGEAKSKSASTIEKEKVPVIDVAASNVHSNNSDKISVVKESKKGTSSARSAAKEKSVEKDF